MSKTIKIAGIQLSSLPLGPRKIEEFAKVCATKDIKLMLFGEYVLNRFFKELINTPQKMIEEQSKAQIEELKRIAEETGVVIVIPMVIKKGTGFLKSIVKFEKNKAVKYFPQQRLINFKHWNEKGFFINTIPNRPKLHTFMLEGVRFGVLFGYELHFDEFFVEAKRRKVDVILLPTASTFASQNRWREILRVRAFLNSLYILRVNRIGRYKEGINDIWEFYGDTLLVAPEGEITGFLSDKEEILVAEIDRSYIKEVRKLWGFT